MADTIAYLWQKAFCKCNSVNALKMGDYIVLSGWIKSNHMDP